MIAIGIVAEYNPFHTGHLLQINTLKNNYPNAIIIAIMSGSFVQRGEPALLDKFKRARMAISAGCDVVFELPSYFAMSNAEQFAAGAIREMSLLNINYCSFGAENADLGILKEIAQVFIDDKFSIKIKKILKDGVSYPTAMQLALDEYNPNLGKFLNYANNLLGIEYIKASLKYNLNMEFIPIKRNSNHRENEKLEKYPSGSYLRQVLVNEEHIDYKKAFNSGIPTINQPLIKNLLETKNYTSMIRFFEYIMYNLRILSKSELELIQDVNEGLENRLKKASDKNSVEEMIDSIKTKRYTYSRLNRILANIVLRRSKKDCQLVFDNGPTYARLLGLNSRGRIWLKNNNPQIPVINKWGEFINEIKNNNANEITNILTRGDILATDLQYLCKINPQYREANADFNNSPYFSL